MQGGRCSAPTLIVCSFLCDPLEIKIEGEDKVPRVKRWVATELEFWRMQNERKTIEWNHHQWYNIHGHATKQKRQREHMKRLRAWWEFLDADGGGTLSVDELEDPLVSVGLATGRADVEKLIEKHDTNGEGELNWKEFVNMVTVRDVMTAKEAAAAEEAAKAARMAAEAKAAKVAALRNRERSGKTKAKKNRDKTLKEGAAPQAAPPTKYRKNALMQLFDDMEDGKFGSSELPLPVQITAYRRQMLMQANMSRDPKLRKKGMGVLKGIIDTKRNQRKDLEAAAMAASDDLK
eukprot:g4065.t1